jgi:hypothetical protein
VGAFFARLSVLPGAGAGRALAALYVHVGPDEEAATALTHAARRAAASGIRSRMRDIARRAGAEAAAEDGAAGARSGRRGGGRSGRPRTPPSSEAEWEESDEAQISKFGGEFGNLGTASSRGGGRNGWGRNGRGGAARQRAREAARARDAAEAAAHGAVRPLWRFARSRFREGVSPRISEGLARLVALASPQPSVYTVRPLAAALEGWALAPLLSAPAGDRSRGAEKAARALPRRPGRGTKRRRDARPLGRHGSGAGGDAGGDAGGRRKRRVRSAGAWAERCLDRRGGPAARRGKRATAARLWTLLSAVTHGWDEDFARALAGALSSRSRRLIRSRYFCGPADAEAAARGLGRRRVATVPWPRIIGDWIRNM